VNLFVLILLVLGLVLFILAGFGVPSRWNLVAFGLACWILTVLIASPIVAGGK